MATPTIEQHLQSLTTELSKVKAEVMQGGARVHAAASDKLPALRARVNAVRQQLGAATHAGLSKFEAELADIESKAKATVAKARGE
jgi:hypothetical protein